MCIAAKNGDLETLKFLYGKGQSINSQDKMGNTPLHYACSGKFQQCIEFMIENGIDEKIENENGQIGWQLGWGERIGLVGVA